jgi:imidazolonepropionase-like amidohydrolase
VENARATLLQGVTAVRNVGNLFDREAAAALAAMRGNPIFPLVVSAGRALTRAGRYGGFLGGAASGAADLLRQVEREIDQGARVVKVILSGSVDLATGTAEGAYFSAAELVPVVRLAHEAGVPVAAHANGAEAIGVALAVAVDTLEHGIFATEEQLRGLAGGETRWVPTLTPLEGLLARPGATALPAVLSGHRAAVARGAELGVRMVAGTDSGCRGVPHSSLGAELRHLRGAGLSPPAVAAAATAEAAAALRLPAGYGHLAPGAATDLVWFAADPFLADPLPAALGLARTCAGLHQVTHLI